MKYRLLKDLIHLKAGVVAEKLDHVNHGDVYWFGDIMFPAEKVENNPEWFEPVDGRYKPEDGDEYWYPICEYPNSWYVKQTTWNGSCEDDYRWGIDIVFRTEAQAKEAAKRIVKTLMGYHKELSE